MNQKVSHSLREILNFRLALWKLLALLGMLALLTSIVVTLWDIVEHTQNLVTTTNLNTAFFPAALMLIFVTFRWSKLIFIYYQNRKEPLLIVGSSLSTDKHEKEVVDEATLVISTSLDDTNGGVQPPNPGLNTMQSQLTLPPASESIVKDNSVGFQTKAIHHSYKPGITVKRTISVPFFNVPKDDDSRGDDRGANNQLQLFSRYAVTDGVSQGQYSTGEWADIIAWRYVEEPVDLCGYQAFMQWIETCTYDWHEWEKARLPQIVSNREKRGQPVDQNWYNNRSERIASGVGATFIGCELTQLSSRYKACVFSVGDAQFFHYHQNKKGRNTCWQLVRSFPYTAPEQFKNATIALTTNRDEWQEVWKQKSCITYADIQKGDIILLTTDAVGEWILNQEEYEFAKWIGELLHQLYQSHSKAQAQFKERILTERRAGKIKVVDSTIMIIACS